MEDYKYRKYYLIGPKFLSNKHRYFSKTLSLLSGYLLRITLGH
jgi:hypothetical protein